MHYTHTLTTRRGQQYLLAHARTRSLLHVSRQTRDNETSNRRQKERLPDTSRRAAPVILNIHRCIVVCKRRSLKRQENTELLMPNTHHESQCDETDSSRSRSSRRRREHNSQLAHDNCRRIRSTILETDQADTIAFDYTNFDRYISTTRMVQLPATAAIEYVTACCRTRTRTKTKTKTETKTRTKIRSRTKTRTKTKIGTITITVRGAYARSPQVQCVYAPSRLSVPSIVA